MNQAYRKQSDSRFTVVLVITLLVIAAVVVLGKAGVM